MFSRNLLFLSLLAVLVVLTARCHSVAPEPRVTEATLLVESRYAPGNTHTFVRWECEAVVVEDQVACGYNAPTGQSAYRGDFHRVLTAATGNAPAQPCRELRDLLTALEAAGWVVQSRTEEEADRVDERVRLTYRREQ